MNLRDPGWRENLIAAATVVAILAGTVYVCHLRKILRREPNAPSEIERVISENEIKGPNDPNIIPRFPPNNYDPNYPPSFPRYQ